MFRFALPLYILLLTSFLTAAQASQKETTLVFKTSEENGSTLCLGVHLGKNQLVTTHNCALILQEHQNQGDKVHVFSLAGEAHGYIQPVTTINPKALMAVYTENPIDSNTPASIAPPATVVAQEGKIYSSDSVANVTVNSCAKNYCQISSHDGISGSPIYHENQLLCIYSGIPGYCDQINEDTLALHEKDTAFSYTSTNTEAESLKNHVCVCDCRKDNNGTAEFILRVIQEVGLVGLVSLVAYRTFLSTPQRPHQE